MLVSLVDGVTHREAPSETEERVFLVLTGTGVVTTDGRELPVAGETIAHFPRTRTVDFKAEGQGILDFLVLHFALTAEEMSDIAARPESKNETYLKRFKECEPYGEKIKSAKTVSRTLFPRGIVPRLAIGTVQTTGPDQVALHRHPMLEQYFLGLEGNDITVIADDIRTPLGAYELFHIPLGSNHGAEVADGRKLHYIWIDFFKDRKGEEWLKEHKPITPDK